MAKPEPRLLELGRQIQEHRERLDLTQDALATIIGCHPDYVAGLEDGEIDPPLDLVRAIAEALKVNTAIIVRSCVDADAYNTIARLREVLDKKKDRQDMP